MESCLQGIWNCKYYDIVMYMYMYMYMYVEKSQVAVYMFLLTEHSDVAASNACAVDVSCLTAVCPWVVPQPSIGHKEDTFTSQNHHSLISLDDFSFSSISPSPPWQLSGEGANTVRLTVEHEVVSLYYNNRASRLHFEIGRLWRR